jgi:hypothetical protein
MPFCGKRIRASQVFDSAVTKGIWRVQLSHEAPVRFARFDDSCLVASAGLVPVMALAQRAGLVETAGALLTVPGSAGSAAGAKVASLVAGMVAGADSISDMGLLRDGAMSRLFAGARAPSTLGTFLRAFRFGHVRQLDAVAARVLAGLTELSPMFAGADHEITYLDVDDTVRATYGYAKQGAGYGYTGVKGLNALLATASIRGVSAAPVIVATRLRKGSVHSARGAARLVADAIKSTHRAGVTGMLVLRGDSAYYTREVIAAARRHSVAFSITARKNTAVTAAIASIPEDAWTTIRYPRAVFDEQLQQWISDAEVAEIPFTAFGSRGKKHAVTARLIVRRVRDANPEHVQVSAQGELFRVWRHHALFTNSPLPMLDAEADHRRHAIIEQVIADLKAGPLAHLPSGSFAANSAWLVLATIAYNLLRATGALASTIHARATTATLRAQLINVAARVVRSSRRARLRLPTNWPWAGAWQRLFTAATGPPTPA